MKVTRGFQALLSSGGVQAAMTPPKARNCIAHAERFVRSIKEEIRDRRRLSSERALQRTLRDYEEHSNGGRLYQWSGIRQVEGLGGR